MSSSRIIGAVEIGTSKTVVLAGEVIDGRILNIIGQGQTRSEGVLKGEIIDFRAASECTHAAISQAESIAGQSLDCIYIAQTGRHLKGFLNTGMVNVSASNNLVNEIDIQRVTENAKSKQLAKEHVYIHHIRNPFRLDGRVVKDPYLMQGEKLEVAFWSVYGDMAKVRDSIHVINGFGLKVEDLIISSLASGSMVASSSEKKNGVLVLDIGCGTTDYILYKNGFVVCTGVIPVGGDHVTNDLSLGLRISLEQAENVKLEHGSAIDFEGDDKVSLLSDSDIEKRDIPKRSVCKIMHLRMKELLELIGKELGSKIQKNNIPAGVVLTGGSSRMDHLDKLIFEVLGLESRIGMNPDWASEDLKNPEYSTALGLLHYGLNDQKQEEPEVITSTNFLSRVAKLFHAQT